MECEPVAVMDDGWTEWIRPAPGARAAYVFACCDCGLVHEVEFALQPPEEFPESDPVNGGGPTWWGEGQRYIVWRMRRADK